MKIIQQVSQTTNQMMGYVVVAKTGEVLAVDGGYQGNGEELRRVIRKVGGHVDLWFITHPHDDHYVAVIEALQEPCDITWDRMGSTFLTDEWGSFLAESDRKELHVWNEFAATLDDRLFEVQVGQSFRLGSMLVEILAVSNPELHTHLNDQSVVIRVTEDDFVLLFLGDLGEAGGRLLLSTGCDLRADAVQMAHHGQNGVDEAFYQAVAPRYAFWATPLWLWTNTFPGQAPNSGPFRTLEVREWMERLNVKNIVDFEHTVCFDTETEATEIF